MILTVKSPSFLEFQNIIAFLNEELESSQLQEVQAFDDGLILGFYRFVKHPKTVYLVIDLDTQFPFVGFFENHPWPKIKKTKPMSLFINSHFKNTHLKSIEVKENFGRVALFDFSTEDRSLQLELRLIPKQPNLLALVKDNNDKKAKQIFWEKPKDLVEVGHEDSTFHEEEARSIPFMFSQWWARRAQAKTENQLRVTDANQQKESPYDQWKKQRQKDIQKKQKAIQQIEQQISVLAETPWVQIGEYLKTYGFQNIPVEWTPYLNFEKKVSFNIELCFEKKKQADLKVAGAQKRLLQLRQEISYLSQMSEEIFQEHLNKLASKQSQQLKRKNVEGQFRKLVLSEAPSLVVYMGKSAAENMKLLRQAKSWDLWVHLKDYPSAYAIIQKNKEQTVSEAQIIVAAQWLVKESLRNKKNYDGLKLAVVVTECRHVKSIKGDKLGRVTYHYPRELLITA